MATGTGQADFFEAEVVDLDDAGSGIAGLATSDGELRVRVPGSLPGERVTGHITYRSVHVRAGRREAWATLQTILRASPHRVVPVCPAQGRCGGCAVMHLAYAEQLAWKQARVRDEFSKYSGLRSVQIEASVPSPLTLGYRNQAKYVYGRAEGGEVVLGAYAPSSHVVVDLAGCRVVEPILEDSRRIVLGILHSHAVEPYREIERTGLLRYVLLRANRAGQVLVTLVVNRGDWPAADAIAADIVGQVPAVAGVVLNVNSGTGNALLGQHERLLALRPTLDDAIGDVRVRLASRSFFQANRSVASRIYRDLVAALPDGLGAVDAYSGAGGIALSLLARAREVVAIEENAAATEAAAEVESDRLRLVTADAAEGLATVEAADLVVLNPPRKGCSREVLAQVKRLAPPIVAYLSCDPATLTRDLGLLVEWGATMTSVRPYDMMPHTPHVETLALLSLRH